MCKCPQHGVDPVRRVKWNHQEDRYSGDYYACPQYAKCGQYFCMKTLTWKQSKKFRNEEV